MGYPNCRFPDLFTLDVPRAPNAVNHREAAGRRFGVGNAYLDPPVPGREDPHVEEVVAERANSYAPVALHDVCRYEDARAAGRAEEATGRRSEEPASDQRAWAARNGFHGRIAMDGSVCRKDVLEGKT